jgi:hypothetical protein
MTAAYPLVQQLVNAQYGEKILPDIGVANQAHEWILSQLPTSIAEMLSPTKDQQQTETPTTKQDQQQKEETKKPTKEPTKEADNNSTATGQAKEPTGMSTTGLVVGGAAALATTVATGNPVVGALAGYEASATTDILTRNWQNEAFYKKEARAKANEKVLKHKDNVETRKQGIDATNWGIKEKQIKFDTNRADKAKSDESISKMLDSKERDQKWRLSDKGIFDRVAFHVNPGNKALLVKEQVIRHEHSGHAPAPPPPQININNNLQDNTRQQTNNFQTNNNVQLPQPKNGFAPLKKTGSNTNSLTLLDSVELNKQHEGLGFTEKKAESAVQFSLSNIQKTTPLIAAPITATTSAEISEQLDGEQLNGEQVGGYGRFFVEAMTNNAMLL